MFSRGERITLELRDTNIDGVGVYLLIATDITSYTVEVETKPSIEDIGRLLEKSEVIKRTSRINSEKNRDSIPVSARPFRILLYRCSRL